ncbi:Lysosome membrane protein 2 [Chionoecetes opilio]|uniref:Lysosome membrane protein 2 n=1 Tax=Chionoecetes opilio TaxID=41210 RepID=A0A8J4XXS0_CHIOP|nr:Lysosome membrane protein 2 [Chionoecetes opilio]
MQLRVQVAVLVVVGVVLVVGAAVVHACFGQVFGRLLDGRLMLVPGSKTLESFKAPPVPILMQFYLFNVTNSQAVVGGAAPVLQQLGPYTYEEKPLKYNLTFDDAEGTVTYLQNKTFYYRPDLSPGVALTDQVTTVNAVMMSLGAKLASRNAAFRAVVQLWFTRFSQEPFVTRSVRELLFDGYEEPLLRQLADLTKDPEHATGRFGFYRKNNTNDGTYTVYTGVRGMDQYQHIARWRGDPQIHFWKGDAWGGDTCNMINGTAGTQFPRPLSRGTPLRLYVAELCRSIYAEYQRDVQHGALTLYRYVLPKRLLANTPDNKCYCSDPFTCRASMINVAPCRKGAPVVVSTPHFYQGDPEDLLQVQGLAPREQEHETFLDVEPNTGVVFRAAKRIQVNLVMSQYGDLPAFRGLPQVILPVLWVNESAEVPLQRTKALHRTLTLPFTLVRVGVGVMAALGLALLLVAALKLWLARRRHNNTTRTPQLHKEKEKTATQKLNDRNFS